jgi:MFS family permease
VDSVSKRRRRAILAVAIGAIALDSALIGLIAPLLPELERRVGATEVELGLALGAYALPQIFVALPLGRTADRFGRRPLLLGGLLLTAAGSILIAASGSLSPLIAGRAIQGVGSAASWIAALALVSDLAPPARKGESIGYALAANSVGAIAGPAFGGILGGAIGFEFPFLLVAGLSLALAVTGALVLERGWVTAPASSLRSMLGLLGRAAGRSALPATLGVVAGALILGVIEVAVPLDADERLGLGAAAIGGLFAATIAFDAVAAPIAGRAGDRVGRVPVASLGLLLTAAAMVLLAVLPGTWGLALGLAVLGVGSGVMFAALIPWLDEVFGDLDRGFGYGLLSVIFAIVYTVGPVLAGVVLHLSGPTLTYLLAALPALAVAALVQFRRGRPLPG